MVEDTDKPLAIFLKTLLDFTLDIFDLNEVLSAFAKHSRDEK
jgi:hypothetical protein